MTSLFTLSELASYLQRDLDTASAQLASDMAHGRIRGWTRQTLTVATSTDPLPIDRDTLIVRMPERPVSSIASVVINGTAIAANVWGGYAWDGYSNEFQVALLPVVASTIIRPWPRAVVTYTHGFATPPDDLKDVALSVAARIYDNPRGLRQESIDDYAYTRGGNDDNMAGAGLLPTEKELLRKYRRSTAALRMR